MTNARIDLRSLLTLLFVSYAASACHETLPNMVGSESHFLEGCEQDAECGGTLHCITGVCTRSCNTAAECSGLGADVTCQQDRCAAHAASTKPPPVKGVDAGTTGQAGAVASPTSADDSAPTSAASLDDMSSPNVIGGGAPCGKTSTFPDDEACLAPPSPDEGIQIHIGPNNYDDQAELMTWVLQPGDEITKCVTFQMPGEDFAFAEWELAERPGVHHAAFLLDMSDGRFDACLQDGSTLAVSPAAPDQLLAAQSPVARAPAAPENAAIARRIPAGAPADAWLHAINITNKPILLELWLNLYKPRAQPTQYDVPVSTGPGTNLMVDQGATELKHFECPITADGRLLSLSALTLPSTRSVDVWLQHADGERIDLLHRPNPDLKQQTLGPTSFRFDSVTMNPAITPMTPSGFTGQVALQAGDVLAWDCTLSGDGSSPFNFCDLGGSATVAIDCKL